MDQRATKDRAEKEQEEVERLVRPAPKVKPPRHDKRRELVEVDDDPDLDRKDKDLSKNYKDIGGSVGSRVFNRWAETAQPAPPKPAAPAKPEDKEPEKKKVKVRSKETGWVGWISEDSLKSRQNEYEAVDDAEEEKFPAKQETAQPQDAPKPEGKPAPEEPNPEADLSAKKELDALRGNSQVKWTLDNIIDPNGVLGHFADKYPAENLLQGQKLPAVVKTVGDLRRVLRTVEPAAPAEPEKPVEKKPGKKKSKPKEDASGDFKKEQEEAQARIKEVKEELKEDPKSEGAKAELAAQKEVLKSIQEVTRIRKELEQARAELAKMGPGQPVEAPSDAPQAPPKTEKPKGKPGKAPPIQAPPPADKKDDSAEPKAPPPAGKGAQPPAAAGEPETPAKPSDPQPQMKYQAPPPEDPHDRAARDQLHEVLKEKPELAQALKDLKKPKSQMSVDVQANPDLNVHMYFGDTLKGVKLPEDIQTMGDLQRVMALQPPSGKKPKAPAAAPAEEKKPDSSAGPQRRAVSPEEQADAINSIYASFPESMSAKLLMIDPPLHPDDVQQLVSDFHVAKSVPMDGNLEDLVKKASGFYATDPNQVAPPKWVKDKTGQKVQFADLKPEEQQAALREHQIRTVAMSMAARDAVASQFKKAKAPEELADAMSDFMLYNSKETQESPQERDTRAAKKASALFYNAIGSGAAPKGRVPQPQVEEEGAKKKKPEKPTKEPKVEVDRFNRNPEDTMVKGTSEAPPVSDKVIKNILKSAKDPAAKRLAVGYFQGQDYLQARKQFLSASSPDAVSERFPVNTIAKKLNKATDWLRKRSELYPANLLAHDTAQTFRSRIMKQLRVLQPEKAAAVQHHLDEYDNKQYDKEAAEFPKAFKKYEAHRSKAEASTKSEYEKYSARLKQDPNYDGPPPLSTEERLASEGVFEPKEPRKPARYDIRRAKPDDLANSAQDMWSEFTSRNASQLSARVAIRTHGHLFSTYPKPFAMGRTAVYWGVAPYEESKPYEGWQQPHARDLDEGDWTRVLKAARVWLKSPMLSKNVEGVVRDTQLRAALDLALRDENLSSALHPVLYNHLLARLAGVPEDETLLTVTASEIARNTMSKKVELETAQADKFLARLDRMASVIQEKHAEWGIPQAAAKALVNEIDKVADEVEAAVYGPDSMLRRQASVMGIKVGEVIQRDSDEKYMDAFKNPMAPHQTEGDEPYMKAYKDDQSSAVHNGKSTTGKPLAK